MIEDFVVEEKQIAFHWQNGKLELIPRKILRLWFSNPPTDVTGILLLCEVCKNNLRVFGPPISPDSKHVSGDELFEITKNKTGYWNAELLKKGRYMIKDGPPVQIILELGTLEEPRFWDIDEVLRQMLRQGTL